MDSADLTTSEAEVSIHSMSDTDIVICNGVREDWIKSIQFVQKAWQIGAISGDAKGGLDGLDSS